jgi:hypothetical protein
MNSFFLALIVAIISIIPYFFKRDKKHLISYIAISVIGYTIAGFLLFYAALPSFAYPLAGGVSAVVIVFSAISTYWCIYGDSEFNWSWILTAILSFSIIIAGFSGCDAFRAKKYASLIGPINNKQMIHWSQDIQPIDPTHIRLVPKESALAKARTVVSKDGKSYGSQFPLSEKYITLQKITNESWYLIPLDFDGWKVWTSVDFVPGYVKVNAVNPNAVPILVNDKKMIYTPGAYFGDNLERRLWHKYYNKVLKDYSFEEDDSGNIRWVISICNPTISYWGLVVEGVSIFDPETGDEEYVSLKDLESNPKYAWVDRAIPQEFVEKYIDYWGQYQLGWTNSWWGKLNILTHETPTMNYSVDGCCVFVTPITSKTKNDDAMSGLMYTDSRTGVSTYYSVSGGATEEKIQEAVNNVAKYKQCHASEQIVYENIFGILSAIVPIISNEGNNYMGLAIVENSTKRVACAWSFTAAEALIEYRKMLAAGGQLTTESEKELSELVGIISRIGWDMSTSGKQYYLYIESSPNKSYIVTSDLQSELALTKEGDSIKISYIKTTENPATAMSFRNLTLNLKYSKNQIYVDSVTTKSKTDAIDVKDVDDFKDKVNNISPEDLKKLINQSKKK